VKLRNKFDSGSFARADHDGCTETAHPRVGGRDKCFDGALRPPCERFLSPCRSVDRMDETRQSRSDFYPDAVEVVTVTLMVIT